VSLHPYCAMMAGLELSSVTQFGAEQYYVLCREHSACAAAHAPKSVFTATTPTGSYVASAMAMEAACETIGSVHFKSKRASKARIRRLASFSSGRIGRTASALARPSIRADTIVHRHAAEPPTTGKNRRLLSRCGECAACFSEDCGTCRFCVDKPRFGGPNIKKRGCIWRICKAVPLSGKQGDGRRGDCSVETPSVLDGLLFDPAAAAATVTAVAYRDPATDDQAILYGSETQSNTEMPSKSTRTVNLGDGLRVPNNVAEKFSAKQLVVRTPPLLGGSLPPPPSRAAAPTPPHSAAPVGGGWTEHTPPNDRGFYFYTALMSHTLLTDIPLKGPPGQAGGGDDEDVDMEVDVRVQKVLRHHVFGGARLGSLHNVYVKLLFEDGSCTVGGVEPSEPLAQSESGRAALCAYVKTKNGMKIAKYVPSEHRVVSVTPAATVY